MFNNKKIKDLEVRLNDLEDRVRRLALRIQEQSEEIDKLHMLFVNMPPVHKPHPPRRKKKTDGKETQKSE